MTIKKKTGSRKHTSKSSPVKSPRTKKAATKKAATKKAATKKAATKKAATKKAATKKVATKKVATKKTATKKAATKKTATKKTATKKTATKKTAKRAFKKKAAIKKPPTKKSVTKKAATKKAGAKKAATKKAGAVATKMRKKSTQRTGTQEETIRTKYEAPSVSSTPADKPKYSFDCTIPEKYNEDYLKVIPRDPEWVFVYWEFTPQLLDTFAREMGTSSFRKSHRILRIHDVTDVDFNGENSWRTEEVEVNLYANNWYLRVPESNRTYIIECGHKDKSGNFHLLMRSNVFSVPRAELSDASDEEWSTLRTDELIRLSADEYKRGVGSSERLAVKPGYLGSGADNL
jgi:hypothetical protein